MLVIPCPAKLHVCCMYMYMDTEHTRQNWHLMVVCPLPLRSAIPAKRYYSGERDMYLEARFGGLEVTLGDEHGDILSANMTGIHVLLLMLVCYVMYMYASMCCISV